MVELNGIMERETQLNAQIGEGARGGAGNGNMIADDFSASTAYAVGDYAIYNGSLYRFTTAHPAGAWNASHATAVQLAEDTRDLKSAIEDIFENDGTADVTPTSSEANRWVYYSSGSTVAYGGTFDGMLAVIAVEDLPEFIHIGYGKTATYPGTSQVIFGMTGSSIPSPGLFYYNQATINAGTHATFGPRGFDLSTIDDGYFTIETAKLKTALPTLEAIAINFPTGTYLLTGSGKKATKYVEFLHIANTVPALVVAADGSGDYTTISDAVSAAKNEDTIYIKDGTYTETVVVNKYLHLVGQSKQGTILQQNIGDYNNCPLLITQGSVCNMTINSLAPADASGLSNYAYAIHLDKYFASLAKYQKCEIYNCDIYSEVNDAIGAGTNYASEYDIHDCFLHVAHNPVKSGACGFKCHNGQNQTTGKVTLRNNVIITEDANGGSIYDILFHNGGISNTQPIEILMVGNVLKYYNNSITNIFVPSGYNYGNSVPAMNTLWTLTTWAGGSY